MYRLDPQEKQIVSELIRNPRISDNKIATRTKIPLKTVNRKRKILEEKNYLYYMTYLNNGRGGLEVFGAKKMYVVTLASGITRKAVQQQFNKPSKFDRITKHLHIKMIAEREGHVCVLFILESRVEEDLVEIFNAEIVPALHELFGGGCIREVLHFDMRDTVRMFNNYMFQNNMRNGKIKDEYPNNAIFVSE